MDGLSRDPAFVLRGQAMQSVAHAGGKAAALAKLAGVWAIPDFFVIAPHAFTEEGLLPAARADVSDALAQLGDGPFAVRSSGVEEDGAAAAHAGQFESELNVALADVAAAAFRVWRSGFGDELAAYRRARGLSDAPQPPAVMVQKMVAARAAGVAFSSCPVSGDRNIVVVSAVRGLADRLVAGETDGDTYRLGPGGDTLARELTSETPVLSPADLVLVAKLTRASEAHFGAPQDVEWAFAGDALLLLQSRPITTLPAVDDAITIWDNSNIVESYAGVTGALTFSFARYVYAHVYRAFSGLMGVSAKAVQTNSAVFENMLGRIDGRIYYDLLNWYRALALFPGFQANRHFMEEMMGVAEALPADLAERLAPKQTNPLARAADQLQFAWVGLRLCRHGLRLQHTIRRFYARLDSALARSNAEIDALPASALAGEYRLMEQKLLTRWDAPLINDFLCMIAFGASRKVMEAWAGSEGLSVHGDVMIGQGDIVSAEPARLIHAMGDLIRDDGALITRLARADRSAVAASPALSAALADYITRFGDRCTQELKLESLSLEQDPSQILMAIAAAARTKRQAKIVRPDEAKARIAALFKGKLFKRAVATWLLKWAKNRVRDRENLRFERTRLFGRVRRIFLGIGAQLAQAGVIASSRDVFFLTIEEVLGAVEGGGVTLDLRALVALRRAEDAASLARADPPERFETRGAHLAGLSRLTAVATPAADAGEVRSGLACAGVVTARVRVIDDPRQEALAPGEILVARHTDPGWIAVFANAAGVIAERGSLLSHSAIVAREMGIPCVVALKGATSWLKSGDLVRLDGGAGRVERLERT